MPWFPSILIRSKLRVMMTNQDLTRLRVMVVDGDAGMTQLIISVLRSLGVRDIFSETDGAEALRLLLEGEVRFAGKGASDEGPDLLLCDRHVPPLDGLELVRRLRAANKPGLRHLPVVMLSGDPTAEGVAEARDAGVTEFLAKPVSAQAMRSRIVEIVDRPRRHVDEHSYVGPDRRRREVDPPFPRRRGD